jgi:GNAT superfamily N-acetyltransferase
VNEARAVCARKQGYRVRAMEGADARAVAELHVRVWREAYAGLMPAEFLAGLDVGRFEQTWRGRLTGDRAPEVVDLVGIHPERGIVAFGAAGPGRDDDEPAAWELYAINVLASEHGSGLADLLMPSLIAGRAAYLWVLEGNRRASTFYARYGFAPDGRTKTRPEIARPELRMVRRTGTESP